MTLPRNRLAREAGVPDSREAVKTYLSYLTKGVTAESVIDRYVDTAPLIIDFIEEYTPLRFYADLERPDVKSALPGGAQYGRLAAPKLYDLKRLGDLRPRLRQPDWERRTTAKGRAAGGGMEAITQQEMQGFEERGDPQGWIELSRQRVRDGIVPRGCALIAAMLEIVAARGATLVTNARARELVMQNGKVACVVSEVDWVRRTFAAVSHVVLAAGGVGGDKPPPGGVLRRPRAPPPPPPTNPGGALPLGAR